MKSFPKFDLVVYIVNGELLVADPNPRTPTSLSLQIEFLVITNDQVISISHEIYGI